MHKDIPRKGDNRSVSAGLGGFEVVEITHSPEGPNGEGDSDRRHGAPLAGSTYTAFGVKTRPARESRERDRGHR